ncbi:MAG: stage III sporulation protein AD [Clostridia bacterium]|nr:stage III sporulation protein AD [Clostridia bacterium]
MIATLLKEHKPEFKIYISIAVGIIIFIIAADKLKDFIYLINNLTQKVSINQEFIRILLKITGISILTEFAVSICKDSGESSIASKIDLGGKIIILSMSIPIITSLLEVLLDLL